MVELATGTDVVGPPRGSVDLGRVHSDEVVYDSQSPIRQPGRLFRSMLRDLRASRELAWRLCLRNISAKYRQSALGYVWAVLPPLVTSLTFVFLRSQRIFDVGETTVPYAAFVMIGTLLWQGFVDALNTPILIISQSKSMISKINFPREALLLAGLGEVCFNFAIRLVLLVFVLIWFRITPPGTVVLVPLGIASLIGLGLMIGILLTPLAMLFSDIQQAIATFLPLVYLATPIAYPPRTVGISAKVAYLNPAGPLVLATRDWLTTGRTDGLPAFLIEASLIILLLGVGWILYRLAMPILTERFSA